MNDDYETRRTERTTVVNRRPEPEEKKSIWRWLLPLLLLLLLGLALAYYLMDRQNDANQDNQSTMDPNNSSQATDMQETQQDRTIASLSELTGATDASTLAGRSVSLASVSVLEVIGDRSFTLGTADAHVFAFLSEQLNSGQAEQAVQIKAGETRSVQGVVVAVPSDTTELMNEFQLTQEQADHLREQGFYISVNQTSVVSSGSDESSHESNTSDMPTGAGTE